MDHIAKEYLLLFNVITDTGEALRALQEKLAEAQQKAEALYLGDAEAESEILAKLA